MGEFKGSGRDEQNTQRLQRRRVFLHEGLEMNGEPQN